MFFTCICIKLDWFSNVNVYFPLFCIIFFSSLIGSFPMSLSHELVLSLPDNDFSLIFYTLKFRLSFLHLNAFFFMSFATYQKPEVTRCLTILQFNPLVMCQIAKNRSDSLFTLGISSSKKNAIFFFEITLPTNQIP